MASICRERGLLVLVRNGIWSRLISTQQLASFSLVVAKPILSSTFKDLEVPVLPKASPPSSSHFLPKETCTPGQRKHVFRIFPEDLLLDIVILV